MDTQLTASINTDRFFGESGAWKEACVRYTEKDLPAEIIAHSKTLGEARIAFCLGYGFAKALHRRQMTIDDDELDSVSKKTSAAPDSPEQFRNGFRRFTA